MNRLAEGNASFWAASTVKYWTARAGDAIDATAAAGKVKRIQSVMFDSPSCVPQSSEEKSDAAEHRVRIGAGWIAIDHLLPSRLQHNLGRWEDRNADIVELRLPGAGRQVEIGAPDPAGLGILEGVAIERYRFPVARHDVAEGQVISEFSRIAIHGLAHIVRGIGVVVGTQIGGVAEADEYVFTACLEAGIGHTVAELGVEHGKARSAERHSAVRIGSARRGVGGVVGAHAAVESWHQRW